MKMPGWNRKTRISTDWLLHLLFPPELAQTKVAFEHGIKNQHFEPGDIVFQQGDLGDSVYVIQEGECDVLREKAFRRSETPSASWPSGAQLRDRPFSGPARTLVGIFLDLAAQLRHSLQNGVTICVH